MSVLREWFTEEMNRLGFAGLEHVFDYLCSMSDTQVSEYLEDLLGSESAIDELARSFIKKRAGGTSTQPSSQPSTTKEHSATHNTKQNTKQKKKRDKTATTGASSSNRSNTKSQGSFANAVSGPRASTSESTQTRAIRSSPVEQAQQRVREYRRTGQIINCLMCGKLEQPIQANGACSFCQAPMFPVYDQTTHSSIDRAEAENTHRSHSREASLIEFPEVFGRYVHRQNSEAGDDMPLQRLSQQQCSSRENESKFKSAPQEGKSLMKKDLNNCRTKLDQALSGLTVSSSSPPQSRLLVDNVYPSVVHH